MKMKSKFFFHQTARIRRCSECFDNTDEICEKFICRNDTEYFFEQFMFLLEERWCYMYLVVLMYKLPPLGSFFAYACFQVGMVEQGQHIAIVKLIFTFMQMQLEQKIDQRVVRCTHQWKPHGNVDRL